MLNIQSGDIVFIAVPHYLYKKVAEATDSPTSHVGIAFVEEQGDCLIAESSVPFCKYTPLDKFLARSDKGWFCIRRLKHPLTINDITALRQECDARMGQLYHLGFKYNSSKQFCSKFVYDVYKTALDIEVGYLESFDQLLKSRPDTSLLFWRMWFLGFIPWSRITITPASQLESDLLETICSSETDEHLAQ